MTHPLTRPRAAGRALVLAAALGCGVPAIATEAVSAGADTALDARVMRVAAELRCLVCQNQSIADSHAELAVDLRRQVRELLRQGRSEPEVLAFMTDRYGDFVRYRPPLKASTALLWFGPALLLVGGMTALLTIVRRRGRLSAARFEPDPVDDPS